MIELKRDIVATTIPYGQKTTLPKGSPVEITQELGGSFTVLTDYGLLRVEGKDSDALGRESAAKQASAVELHTDPKTVATAVWDQLKTCYDPEIPVNIVDLGLIYGVGFQPADDANQDVTIEMTLTAQGCPAHVQISEQVKSRLEQLPGIRTASVNIVWTPPWTPERLSADARKQLGIE